MGSCVYKLEALGVLMGSLEFALQIVTNLTCIGLCLFDAIIELYDVGEKAFNEHLRRHPQLHKVKAFKSFIELLTRVM